MSSPGKTLASSYLILSAFMLGFGVPGWATWVVCLTLGLLCDFLSPRAFDFYNLETSDASTAGCWFHDQVPEMATKGAGLLPWVPPFSLWMPFNYERCCGVPACPMKAPCHFWLRSHLQT